MARDVGACPAGSAAQGAGDPNRVTSFGPAIRSGQTGVSSYCQRPLPCRAVPAAGVTIMKLSRNEFERLAMEHLDMLYRVARRLTHNPTSAEDLVQETFLRALRSYDGFDLKD